MDQLMRTRLAAPAAEGARDLFDLLLDARDPETGAGFTPAQLRDQMATLIVAGHETTALALFWSLYLVANAPDVQTRLAAKPARSTRRTRRRAGLPSLVYPRGRRGSDAAVSAGVHAGAGRDRRRSRGRRDDPARLHRADRPLGAASARQVLARPGGFRSVAVRGRAAPRAPLRLPALRRRAASVRRRAICFDRSGAGSGDAGAAVRDLARGDASGAAGGRDHDAAGPSGAVPVSRAGVTRDL